MWTIRPFPVCLLKEKQIWYIIWIKHFELKKLIMQESNNWKTEITYGIEVTASEFIIYIQFLRQLQGAGTSHCSQRNADTTSSKISQRNLARKPKNMVLIINEADVSDRFQLSKQIELPVKKIKKSVVLNFFFKF